MLSGCRYRLKLTAVQAALCEEFGNICRAVWNTDSTSAASTGAAGHG
ncbi:helix-turn-helix domain-containing protein [Streptomyces sp. NPDC093982]